MGEPAWGVLACGSVAGLAPAPGGLEGPGWAELEIRCKKKAWRGLRLVFVRGWGGWKMLWDLHRGIPALLKGGVAIRAAQFQHFLGWVALYPHPAKKSWDFSPVLASDSSGYRISWVYCPAQQTFLPEQPLRLLARLEAEISPQNGAGKKTKHYQGFCFRRAAVPPLPVLEEAWRSCHHI